jgi:hypothetical protein
VCCQDNGLRCGETSGGGRQVKHCVKVENRKYPAVCFAPEAVGSSRLLTLPQCFREGSVAAIS